MKMEHFEYAECENISRNLNEVKGEAKGQVEGDALFIEIVRGYPHIYTKNFKDKEKRDQSWAEIATTCNCSVEECQRRWLRLRERFAKERRLRDVETRNGRGSSSRAEFPLYKNLLFLSEHVRSRQSKTNLKFSRQPQLKINTGTPSPCPTNAEICKLSIPPTQPPLTSRALSASPSPCATNVETWKRSPILSQTLSSSLSAYPTSPETYKHFLMPSSQLPSSSSLLCKENDTASNYPSAPSPTKSLSPCTMNAQGFKDFRSPSPALSSPSSEASSNNHFSANKRTADNVQTTQATFEKWRKTRKQSDPIERSFLQISSQISSYLHNLQAIKSSNNSSNNSSLSSDESFGRWIGSELQKLSEEKKAEKKVQIVTILFSK